MASCRRGCVVPLQGVEDAGGGLHSFGRGVELGGQAAGRQVGLGGQDEDGQSCLERQAPVEDSQSHRHGHHCHRDGGRQFQHESGEEGDAQGAHRLAPVPVGQGGEGGHLVAAPAEDLEGGQGPQGIEEAGAEVGESLPAPGHPGPGGPAHQGPEHRDQGQGGQDDDRRQGVEGEHPGEHEGRHRGRQGQLRQVAGEVGVEGLDAPPRGGRQGPGPLPGALSLGHPLQQGPPQSRLDAGGAVVGGDLGGPGRHRRGHGQPGQAGQLGPQSGETLAGKAPGDDAGEEHGAGDGQRRPGEAQQHRRPQEGPGSPPQPEQAPVYGAGRGGRRRQPVGDSCSRVTRLRNTQYDQAW